MKDLKSLEIVTKRFKVKSGNSHIQNFQNLIIKVNGNPTTIPLTEKLLKPKPLLILRSLNLIC